MTGYLHPDYAGSLSEFGTPRPLPQSGAHVLVRPVPGHSAHDAMGCYPLFVCPNWPRLVEDLEEPGDLVCLTLVTDPFGSYDEAYLQRCFPDRMIPFKQHFVADLRQPAAEFVSSHHRYYAKRALKKVSVEVVSEPGRFVDEWTGLYAVLVARLDLKGIKRFSRDAFARQLAIPGLVMFRAVHQGEAVGAMLWYIQGEVAYSHLAASSPVGYDLSASYALYWNALEYFGGRVRYVDVGGGAGYGRQDDSGLAFFKRGWTNDTRMAYLCGRVFDRAAYRELTTLKGVTQDDYFPAYRRGEFG
jgi:hypothetical protein